MRKLEKLAKHCNHHIEKTLLYLNQFITIPSELLNIDILEFTKVYDIVHVISKYSMKQSICYVCRDIIFKVQNVLTSTIFEKNDMSFINTCQRFERFSIKEKYILLKQFMQEELDICYVGTKAKATEDIGTAFKISDTIKKFEMTTVQRVDNKKYRFDSTDIAIPCHLGSTKAQLKIDNKLKAFTSSNKTKKATQFQTNLKEAKHHNSLYNKPTLKSCEKDHRKVSRDMKRPKESDDIKSNLNQVKKTTELNIVEKTEFSKIYDASESEKKLQNEKINAPSTDTKNNQKRIARPASVVLKTNINITEAPKKISNSQIMRKKNEEKNAAQIYVKGINDTRSTCRKKLLEAILSKNIPEGVDPEMKAKELEEQIYTVNQKNDIKYKNSIRSRCFNLADKANPLLHENFMRGIISSATLSVMTHDDMASEKLKNLRLKLEKENLNAAKYSPTKESTTSLVKCNNCRSYNCTYNQLQTRSADEPMTVFAECLDCGKRMRF